MPSSRRCSRINQHCITDFLASTPDHLIVGVSQRLAVPIPGFDSQLNPAPGFPADKWLLSSAVQKLIRRGLAEQAVKIALALHVLDPAYLPRRLPIIAFEDISIGDLGVCFDILHVFGRQRFAANTSEIGQRQLLANLVYRLARSVKSRSACDIVCLADTEPNRSRAAAKLMKSSKTCWIKTAVDRNAPTINRALALHLLSGMSVQAGQWYRPVSRFDAEALDSVAEKLSLPPVIAWMLVNGRDTSGLAAMLPLVLEAVENGANLQIKRYRNGQARALAESPILGVIPCAADMHTSIGRRAITEYSRAVRQKYPRLFKTVPNVSKLMGMAIFHFEGSKLDRWPENENLAQYRERIERAELQALGLVDPALHKKLYQMLEDECRLLWQIRKAHLLSVFGAGK